MVPVADPSDLFLGEHAGADATRDAASDTAPGRRRSALPGCAVVATVEGRRPLLAEVQALVGRGSGPRRATQGVDANRVALVLAVLEQRVGTTLGGGDVFVSAVGGARLAEPAADLGIALALVSAATGNAVPSGTVAAAEVGLGGELRPVPHLQWRLAEAARLGFRRAIVAPSAPVPADLDVLPAPTLAAAIDAAEMVTSVPRSHRPCAEPPGTVVRWRLG
jgi:DNA repair protein RadA/Sms